jgi:hypothetical protein
MCVADLGEGLKPVVFQRFDVAARRAGAGVGVGYHADLPENREAWR